MRCACEQNQAIEIIGLTNPDNIPLTAADQSWTEISIPEIITIPNEKPDVEQIEQIFVSVKIISKRVVVTPSSADNNAEGTKLTGKKLIIEGILKQKIVYTANVPQQSVHSAHFEVPFSAFVVISPDATLETKYCVEVVVEDVFAKVFNPRDIFKNVTLFLRAYPAQFVGCP